MRVILLATFMAAAMFGLQAQAPQGNLATTKQTADTGLPLGKPGPGMVWVNAKKKIYYRQGDPHYGTTKKGTYMSEGDALNSGYLYWKQKKAAKAK